MKEETDTTTLGTTNSFDLARASSERAPDSSAAICSDASPRDSEASGPPHSAERSWLLVFGFWILLIGASLGFCGGLLNWLPAPVAMAFSIFHLWAIYSCSHDYWEASAVATSEARGGRRNGADEASGA